MREPFKITLPAPPSGKNGQRILGHGAKCPTCGKRETLFVKKSAEATAAEESIHRAARFHTGIGGDMSPLFPSEDVTTLITYHARSGTIEVEVYPVCDRPDGFTGRTRDLHNIPDVLLDALQGVVFTNDNQVRRIALVRDLD